MLLREFLISGMTRVFTNSSIFSFGYIKSFWKLSHTHKEGASYFVVIMQYAGDFLARTEYLLCTICRGTSLPGSRNRPQVFGFRTSPRSPNQRIAPIQPDHTSIEVRFLVNHTVSSSASIYSMSNFQVKQYSAETDSLSSSSSSTHPLFTIWFYSVREDSSRRTSFPGNVTIPNLFRSKNDSLRKVCFESVSVNVADVTVVQSEKPSWIEYTRSSSSFRLAVKKLNPIPFPYSTAFRFQTSYSHPSFR